MSSRRRPAAPMVMAIGGFDPSCGAGVVADARSIEAMGAMPLAVVTAITVQSGTGVRSFTAVPVSRVLAQIDELFAQLAVAAVKIGQVPTAALAAALARRLKNVRPGAVPIVLDPVLRATGGGSLASNGAGAAIATSLLPLASIVTVNLAEASAFVGRPVRSLAGMRRAALHLAGCGAGAVLVKGGHLAGDPVDLLHAGGKELLLRSRRIEASMHGTGCALASALAARLACGDDLETATRAAREHVRSLLGATAKAGAGRLRPPSAY